MSNDRFKFRVFDKNYNDYLPEGVLLDGRTGEVAGTKYDGYIIEQCTGLKDKNGKLIFEGDIITTAFEYETPTEYDTYAVKWCEAYAGELFCTVDARGEPTNFYGGIPSVEYCRVIGNIHEMEVTK